MTTPCPHCHDHHPRFTEPDGSLVHRRVFTPRQGARAQAEALGPCLDPPKPSEKVHQEIRRSAEECIRRIRELAGTSAVSRVIAEARETFATRSQPREPGEEG